MSNPSNSADATRNHPAKVIVLKNMQSFKFDPSKNFLATTTSSVDASSAPLLNFKPQQLFSAAAPAQQLQLIASESLPAPAVTVQAIQTVSPKILIRAAQTPQVGIVAAKQQSNVAAATATMAGNMPIQAVATLRNNKSTIIPKQTLFIQQKPAALVTPTTTTNAAAVLKPISSQPPSLAIASNPPKLTIRGTAGKFSAASKPIAIRPKVDSSQQQQQPKIQQVAFTISPPALPVAYSRFTSNLTYTGPPVPALTLIKPKQRPVEIVEQIVDIREKTPESLIDIRRIIEGEQNEMEQQVALIQSNHSASSSLIELDDNANSSQDELQQQHESNSSSHSLLCDEIIDSVTPESDKNKSSSVPATTPAKEEGNETTTCTLADDVKKNLDEILTKSEHGEMQIEIIEEDSKATDFEDSLQANEQHVKADGSIMVEILPHIKPKRARKPKNSLPYKPIAPNRRSKSEMKLELELDFHDPINHIQWDDGIGGLDNCNKLFGFDEFGLVEVLDKKDLMAKFREPSGEVKCKAKLKKITSAEDRFVCSACSKHGTIRDFFLPEACSEACMAIMKRKTQYDPSIGTRESSFESDMTTPVDERKLMFDGELIPLNQLHQHVVEQNLPERIKMKARKNANKQAVTAEVKFHWDTYLSSKSCPAPMENFKSPAFPTAANPFRVAMKLEAIDPSNQKLFCICTVEEKLGYRIKLHFDGYSASYDFWCNADSPVIFPAGFCQATNRFLSVPPKWNNKTKFDWSEYLDFCNAIGAQKTLFPHLNQKTEHPLEAGMKLEAEYKDKIYPATIVDVLQTRILIEYDTHPEIPAIWIDVKSPIIHPCNYHKTLDKPDVFVYPVRPFEWDKYIEHSNSKAAPTDFLLQSRSPCNFQTGQKLEVVDPVNPQLIRPATILCREEYKIQVIFDGFDISFAFWFDDDSEDIHPINWCEKTGHPIEHPAGFNEFAENKLCKNPGCRGIGNAKFSEKHSKYFHETDAECPYNKDNWCQLMSSKGHARTEPKAVAKKTPRKQEFTNGRKREFLIKEEFVEDSSMDVPEFAQPAKITKTKRTIKKRKLSLTENGHDEPQPKAKVAKSSHSMPSFLKEYGPQLNHQYALWKKNSKVLDRASVDQDLTENPMNWSLYKVCRFVQKVTNSDEITKKFQDQDIDGSAFVCLGQEDLMELLNIKTGPAIKIYNRILHIREEIGVKFLTH